MSLAVLAASSLHVDEVTAQTNAAAQAQQPAGSTPKSPSTLPYTSEAHDALVRAVRDGQSTPVDALAQLTQWRSQPIEAAVRRRIHSDGVLWATTADRPAEAARWAREAPVELLADYAIEPAFRAARTVADLSLEEDAVRQMRKRAPQEWMPRILEAIWLVDARRFDEADARLTALATQWQAGPGPTNEQRVALLEARGALASARGRRLEALGEYDDIARLRPDNLYAVRRSSFLTADAAAPTAALAEAEAAEKARPGSFTPLELSSLRQQALGQEVRWAEAERDQLSGQGPAVRFASLDKVLPRYTAEIENARERELQRRDAGDTATAEQWRSLRLRLVYDRMVALAARGRFKDVTAEYEALRANDITPPYYVLTAVAGGYQQQRQSDVAVPIYEQALREGGDRIPVPSDTHIGLVYAYLDIGRFDDAENLLQKLEAATPPLLRYTPEQGRPNPEYGEVRNLRAVMQLYTDRPGQAEQTFASLSALAPLNPGFRAGQAETARNRNQPEAALDRYRQTLTDHPEDVSARAGYAMTLFDAGELRAGRELTEKLEAEAPESIAVRNAVRTRDAVMAPRLDVEAGAAKDGGALANNEWRVDSRLSSGWLQDSWRLFYHQVLAHASTDEGNVRLARAGLGVEYLKGRWNLIGEIHQANDGPYRTGAALGVRYRASDHWRLSADFDSNSLETPWKARRAGIGAHSGSLGASYIVNEARSFDSTYTRMDFSDGNVRDAFGLSWRERWITGPRFQLDTVLGAEHARSDLQNVPYYSPSSENVQQLTVRGRYLTWKRDDRRFSQIGEVSGGSYQESGFGSGALWSIRYGHEWDIGNAFQVHYGVGISSHPYDGVKERRKFVYLSLSVPLR